MKKILLSLTISLLFVTTISAQDPCKGIIKTVKELEEKTTYETPIAFSGNDMSVDRTITKQGDYGQIFFMAKGYRSDYNAKGVYVKLSDGTILKEPEAKVSCSYMSGGTYLYIGHLDMTDENYEKLSQFPVVMFSIAEIEKKPSLKYATKMMGYVKCIFSDKY